MKLKTLVTLILISTYLNGQDLNEYFIDNNIIGGISLYNLQNKSWLHSDKDYANKGTLPASTFKIINTIIALEEGIINNQQDIFKWDGKPKLFKSIEIPNWNKDNNLEMAFKNSTIWYYEEIARQINKRKYCQYLKKAKYSNRKIKNSKGNDFWNYGTLKVSPIEQIELLIKLFHNQLPFNIKFQALTKELMIEEEHSEYTIRSKTGWSYDKVDIGWYIGFIEIKNNVIFFATRIEKSLDEELNEFSNLRKSITKQILEDLYNVKIN